MTSPVEDEISRRPYHICQTDNRDCRACQHKGKVVCKIVPAVQMSLPAAAVPRSKETGLSKGRRARLDRLAAEHVRLAAEFAAIDLPESDAIAVIAVKYHIQTSDMRKKLIRIGVVAKAKVNPLIISDEERRAIIKTIQDNPGATRTALAAMSNRSIRVIGRIVLAMKGD